MAVPIDASFKRFLRNRRLLLHLLRLFPVRSISVDQIEDLGQDCTNLIGPKVDQRELDSLWWLQMKDGELVFLIIECQSRPDTSMHWRMFHAIGILGLRLSQSPPRHLGYTSTCNPLLRGLVVYSGRREWKVPLDTADAAGLPQPKEKQDDKKEDDEPRREPSSDYRLLDLRQIKLPDEKGNLLVLLQRLQVCETPEALNERADWLRELVACKHFEELAPAFAGWITWVLLPEMGITGLDRNENLREVLEMLETKRMNWAQTIREEGWLNGYRDMLIDQAGTRFGESVTEPLAALLRAISDRQRLTEVGRWLVDGVSGDTLLARLEQR